MLVGDVSLRRAPKTFKAASIAPLQSDLQRSVKMAKNFWRSPRPTLILVFVIAFAGMNSLRSQRRSLIPGNTLEIPRRTHTLSLFSSSVVQHSLTYKAVSLSGDCRAVD